MPAELIVTVKVSPGWWTVRGNATLSQLRRDGGRHGRHACRRAAARMMMGDGRRRPFRRRHATWHMAGVQSSLLLWPETVHQLVHCWSAGAVLVLFVLQSACEICIVGWRQQWWLWSQQCITLPFTTKNYEIPSWFTCLFYRWSTASTPRFTELVSLTHSYLIFWHLKWRSFYKLC